MEIVKKIGGYLLMIIATVLAIAVLATLPGSILKSFKQIQETGTIGIAYFVGTLVMNLLFATILFFMIKTGLKLIQNKKNGT